ncbi:MAG TPA: DUF1854 domain-containing protein [Planctomycetes bacterium]|nr:DUF1854 domain-containing protein [Planctomycetota bacterium]
MTDAQNKANAGNGEIIPDTAAQAGGDIRFSIEYLDPETLSFERTPAGTLRLHVRDKACWLDVRIGRAFPVTNPEHYIEVRARDNTSIGMIFALAAISEANRRLVAEEIEKSYVVPIITSIAEMREEQGTLYMAVDTDRGKSVLYVFHPHDDIVHLRDGRLRIKDALDNIYEIRPWMLDQASLKLIDKLV